MSELKSLFIESVRKTGRKAVAFVLVLTMIFTVLPENSKAVVYAGTYPTTGRVRDVSSELLYIDTETVSASTGESRDGKTLCEPTQFVENEDYVPENIETIPELADSVDESYSYLTVDSAYEDITAIASFSQYEQNSITASGIYKVTADTVLYNLVIPADIEAVIYVEKGKTLTIVGRDGTVSYRDQEAKPDSAAGANAEKHVWQGLNAIEIQEGARLGFAGAGKVNITGGKGHEGQDGYENTTDSSCTNETCNEDNDFLNYNYKGDSFAYADNSAEFWEGETVAARYKDDFHANSGAGGGRGGEAVYMEASSVFAFMDTFSGEAVILGGSGGKGGDGDQAKSLIKWVSDNCSVAQPSTTALATAQANAASDAASNMWAKATVDSADLCRYIGGNSGAAGDGANAIYMAADSAMATFSQDGVNYTINDTGAYANGTINVKGGSGGNSGLPGMNYTDYSQSGTIFQWRNSKEDWNNYDTPLYEFYGSFVTADIPFIEIRQNGSHSTGVSHSDYNIDESSVGCHWEHADDVTDRSGINGERFIRCEGIYSTYGSAGEPGCAGSAVCGGKLFLAGGLTGFEGGEVVYRELNTTEYVNHYTSVFHHYENTYDHQYHNYDYSCYVSATNPHAVYFRRGYATSNYDLTAKIGPAARDCTIYNGGGTSFFTAGNDIYGNGSYELVNCKVTNINTGTGTMYTGNGESLQPAVISENPDSKTYITAIRVCNLENRTGDSTDVIPDFYVLNAGDYWCDADGDILVSDGLLINGDRYYTKDMFVSPQGYLYISSDDGELYAPETEIEFDVAIGCKRMGKAGDQPKNVVYGDNGTGIFHFKGTVGGGVYANWAEDTYKTRLKDTDEKATSDSSFDVTWLYDITPADAEDVIGIGTPGELAALAWAVNNHVAVAGTENDEDPVYFADLCYALTSDVYIGGMYWTPIGTEDHPFCGQFDGADHTVYNMRVRNYSDFTSYGLFGTVYGAEIKKINFTTSTFSIFDTVKNTRTYYGQRTLGSDQNRLSASYVSYLGSTGWNCVESGSHMLTEGFYSISGGNYGTEDVGVFVDFTTDKNICAGIVAGHAVDSRINYNYSCIPVIVNTTSGNVYAGGITGYAEPAENQAFASKSNHLFLADTDASEYMNVIDGNMVYYPATLKISGTTADGHAYAGGIAGKVAGSTDDGAQVFNNKLANSNCEVVADANHEAFAGAIAGSTVYSAVLSNAIDVNAYGMKVSASSSLSNAYSGMFGYVVNGESNDHTGNVMSGNEYCNYPVNITASALENAYAGGIAGFILETPYRANKVNINTSCINGISVLTSGEQCYSGGQIGYMYCLNNKTEEDMGTVEAEDIRAKLYDITAGTEASSASYAGGLIGFIKIDNKHAYADDIRIALLEASDIRDCSITAVAASNTYAGGLIGYSDTNASIGGSGYADNLTLANNIVSAESQNSAIAAGIVALSQGNVLISNTFAESSIISAGTGDDCASYTVAGGFAGEHSGSGKLTITECNIDTSDEFGSDEALNSYEVRTEKLAGTSNTIIYAYGEENVYAGGFVGCEKSTNINNLLQSNKLAGVTINVALSDAETDGNALYAGGLCGYADKMLSYINSACDVVIDDISADESASRKAGLFGYINGNVWANTSVNNPAAVQPSYPGVCAETADSSDFRAVYTTAEEFGTANGKYANCFSITTEDGIDGYVQATTGPVNAADYKKDRNTGLYSLSSGEYFYNAPAKLYVESLGGTAIYADTIKNLLSAEINYFDGTNAIKILTPVEQAVASSLQATVYPNNSRAYNYGCPVFKKAQMVAFVVEEGGDTAESFLRRGNNAAAVNGVYPVVKNGEIAELLNGSYIYLHTRVKETSPTSEVLYRFDGFKVYDILGNDITDEYGWDFMNMESTVLDATVRSGVVKADDVLTVKACFSSYDNYLVSKINQALQNAMTKSSVCNADDVAYAADNSITISEGDPFDAYMNNFYSDYSDENREKFTEAYMAHMGLELSGRRFTRMSTEEVIDTLVEEGAVYDLIDYIITKNVRSDLSGITDSAATAFSVDSAIRSKYSRAQNKEEILENIVAGAITELFDSNKYYQKKDGLDSKVVSNSAIDVNSSVNISATSKSIVPSGFDEGEIERIHDFGTTLNTADRAKYVNVGFKFFTVEDDENDDTLSFIEAVNELAVATPFDGPIPDHQPTVTEPEPADEIYVIPVVGKNTVQVLAAIDDNIAKVYEISDSDIEKTLADNNDDNPGTIIIDLSNGDLDIDTVVLNRNSLENFRNTIEKHEKIDSVTVKTKEYEAVADEKALKAVIDQTTGDTIELVVQGISADKSLNSNQKNAISKLNVVRLFECYFVSNGVRISDFRGGSTQVTINNVIAAGTNPDAYTVYYLDPSGATSSYVTSSYLNNIKFMADHFSEYAVIYDETLVKDTDKDADGKDDSEKKLDIDDIKTGTTFGRLRARSEKQTKTTVTVKWNKVPEADGYIVYGAECGKKNKLKKIATIEDNDTLSFKHTGLEKANYYKYKVKAYKVVDGKKVVISASMLIHATTKGGKYGVAKAVNVSKVGSTVFDSQASLKVKIKRNKTAQIVANEVVTKLPIDHHCDIRYESSNEYIAMVDENGVITANAKGSATIFVYAQNGVYKKIKVTVK